MLLVLGCASAPPAPDQPALSTSGRNDTAWRYALVVDASSSASTLQVFEWRPGVEGRLPVIVPAPRAPKGGEEPAWEMRVRPGVGSYAGRPREAAASLEPLLRFALEKIGTEAETLARTSVFVRATAGMRLLNEEEQDAILTEVEALLASIEFGEASARVISGAEEGLYGWLTANYLLGHLEHGGPFPTVGALDLGGASAQITFQPLDFPRRESHAISLGSNIYHLYSKSYLGLGQDQARESVASPACFLVGYPSAAGAGTGDFDACRAAIREALAQPCSEDERPCSLFGAYQPPLYGDFLAVSVYAYVADFFDLSERLRPDELARAGRTYCARDWREWVAEDPTVAENPYLPLYCYSAAHVATLLTDGFGFPGDTERITAPLRARGGALGWTLGALLFEVAGAVVLDQGLGSEPGS